MKTNIEVLAFDVKTSGYHKTAARRNIRPVRDFRLKPFHHYSGFIDIGVEIDAAVLISITDNALNDIAAIVSQGDEIVLIPSDEADEPVIATPLYAFEAITWRWHVALMKHFPDGLPPISTNAARAIMNWNAAQLAASGMMDTFQ